MYSHMSNAPALVTVTVTSVASHSHSDPLCLDILSACHKEDKVIKKSGSLRPYLEFIIFSCLQ